jgi:hypothetical protein
LSKYFFNTVKNVLLVKNHVAQKSFLLPENVLDKSKACFRRLQNSPSAQTLVIADLTLRQDFNSQNALKAAQMDVFWATWRYLFTRFHIIISLNKKIQ